MKGRTFIHHRGRSTVTSASSTHTHTERHTDVNGERMQVWELGSMKKEWMSRDELPSLLTAVGSFVWELQTRCYVWRDACMFVCAVSIYIASDRCSSIKGEMLIMRLIWLQRGSYKHHFCRTSAKQSSLCMCAAVIVVIVRRGQKPAMCGCIVYVV